MIPVLVFDIETIPDVPGLRTLNGSPRDLSDAEVADAAFAARREKSGSDFLPHHLHRVAAISCVFRDDEGFRVKSLGNPQDSEQKLIHDFFRIIDKYTPQLVSWNGGGFDLPVLHYRAMVNGVTASRYWEMGDEDRDFKWNNYLSRYHSRHLDLMDLLALYTGRANAPLDDLAKLCGFPGKLGVDGSQVWTLFQEGRLGEIRDYCETDVVNTYLVYCRFLLMRGLMTRASYEAEIELVRSALAALDGQHWKEYLAAWQPAR
ncbi:3'-5' exonuclease [Noviherbaspirillum autotrophicum]|uniref:3'-5' exonuclease n=1 Tax=Noviherbaspirillum autotrophicum TaxID=709839 RepID=A0A0C2BMI5_9BURK|nr:3'-5' exonuclease [Noviherbaspirillum autotrophicum]KIF82445.1 3'-5' exonuclease [Noviherbaspirillum autotrophicum]